MNHYEQIGLHLIYKNPGRSFDFLDHKSPELANSMVCLVDLDKLTDKFIYNLRQHAQTYKIPVVCVVDSKVRITNRKSVPKMIHNFPSASVMTLCDSVGYLLSYSVQLVKNRYGKPDEVIS